MLPKQQQKPRQLRQQPSSSTALHCTAWLGNAVLTLACKRALIRGYMPAMPARPETEKNETWRQPRQQGNAPAGARQPPCRDAAAAAVCCAG